jgi:hypothetical protein
VSVFSTRRRRDAEKNAERKTGRIKSKPESAEGAEVIEAGATRLLTTFHLLEDLALSRYLRCLCALRF